MEEFVKYTYNKEHTLEVIWKKDKKRNLLFVTDSLAKVNDIKAFDTLSYDECNKRFFKIINLFQNKIKSLN